MANGYNAQWRPIFDNWTALDYKRATWHTRGAARNHLAPTWVGHHFRRLQAYKILQSYMDNASRYFRVPEYDSQEAFWESLRTNLDHREYGDADLLVKVIVSAVLGDSQEIHVDEADEYEDPNGVTTVSNTPQITAAYNVQEKLRQWSEDENLRLKLVSTETKASSLGDGVYALGYDTQKKRPRLRTWDPSFYFPVFDDFANDDEFPTKIHIAFENLDIETQDEQLERQPQIAKVRRITYELRDVEPYSVPWSTERSTQACFMTDGIWVIDRMKAKSIDFTGPAESYATIIDEAGEQVSVRDLNTGYDFIPVVHLPNTPSDEHFGQSSLLKVLQLLDDVQEADSDLSKARALTGAPMLAASGVSNDGAPVKVGPGELLRLGVSGKVDVIDAAKGLAEMRSAVMDLLERLQVNSRVPDAVVGRMEGKREPSGIALAIKYGPLIAMIDHMRLVRNEKYQLLLKMTQRMFQLDGQLPAGDTHKANLILGTFMPADTGAVVTQVTALLAQKAISRKTAAAMLIAAGVPIDDVAAELHDIAAEDFAGAVSLLDATQDLDLVGEYLDRKITPKPAPQPLDVNQPVVPGRQPPGNGQPPVQ